MPSFFRQCQTKPTQPLNQSGDEGTKEVEETQLSKLVGFPNHTAANEKGNIVAKLTVPHTVTTRKATGETFLIGVTKARSVGNHGRDNTSRSWSLLRDYGT